MASTEGNILSSLGINPIYLIGQVVNFTILVLVLKKFLYQPILNKLDERAKLVAKGVKAAEENAKMQEKMESEYKKKLGETQKEVEKIIAKSKEDGKKMYEDIVQKGKSDAAKMLEQEQHKFKDYITQQEKQLQNKMVDLSSDIARKILEKFLDKDTKKEVLKSQLSKIAEKQI